MSELALKLIREAKRTRATRLDLGNCGLTELPEELFELVWLEELILDSGTEREFDFQEKSKNSLSYLLKRLTNDPARHRPPSRNLLSSIPSKISNLYKLTKLVVTGRVIVKGSIKSLTPLSSLKNLEHLILRHNKVENLAPLKTLRNLKYLYLGGNPIQNIEPLSELELLNSLELNSTKIRSIEIIKNFKNLERLGIAFNEIKSIEPLESLMQLTQLELIGTNIESLRPILPLIKKGVAVEWDSDKDDRNGIFCGHNFSWNDPPEPIIRQGNAAILNYFAEKEKQGTVKLYESKLLILGEGGFGKTSLVKKLLQSDAPLPPKEGTTRGIDIQRLDFKTTDGHDYRLNIWDFAGQEIYHATHQFFLTRRSVYVLLDNTRQSSDTESHHPTFNYWLQVIELLGGESPIFIFQNEEADRSKKLDLSGMKGRFEQIKECYAGNLAHAGSADAVKKAIQFAAENSVATREELPARWVDIRREIESLAEREPYISLDRYFEIYKSHLEFDRQKALFLSQYLHDLGVFLHFQDEPLLKKTVILQNGWATEAVFKILDEEAIKKAGGRFKKTEAESLWSESRYADMHDELLALMEKFELTYRLPDAQPTTFLATQLLPVSRPAELVWSSDDCLSLRLDYGFLPKGLLPRLMVRLHRHVRQPELAWRNGVLFEREGATALATTDFERKHLFLQVKGGQPMARKELLTLVSEEIDRLNESFPGLRDRVERWIPCDCSICKSSAEPHFFSFKNLKNRQERGRPTVECDISFEERPVGGLLDGLFVSSEKRRAELAAEKNLKAKKVFISYAHADETGMKELEKHLASLKKSGQIEVWTDRQIPFGATWLPEILNHLDEADLILMLVSADFFNSKFIQTEEIPVAMARRQTEGALICPVIYRNCDWEETAIAQFQAKPKDGKPVVSFQNQDEAWTEVVKAIRAVLK